MPTLEEAIEALDRAERTLHAAAQAAIAAARATARETEARVADDDEWSRLPTGKGKCPVSKWSRSTLLRKIAESDPAKPETIIRRKTVKGGGVYYSAADVRRYLNAAPAVPGN